eukprot:6540496-Pyramimonas_sp.AAC.1
MHVPTYTHIDYSRRAPLQYPEHDPKAEGKVRALSKAHGVAVVSPGGVSAASSAKQCQAMPNVTNQRRSMQAQSIAVNQYKA